MNGPVDRYLSMLSDDELLLYSAVAPYAPMQLPAEKQRRLHVLHCELAAELANGSSAWRVDRSEYRARYRSLKETLAA